MIRLLEFSRDIYDAALFLHTRPILKCKNKIKCNNKIKIKASIFILAFLKQNNRFRVKALDNVQTY